MTETYLIEISTEQKQTLMAIFEAFKVPIMPISEKERVLASINADEKDKAIYADLIDGIEWSNAKSSGKIAKGQSLSSFLDEVETELETEKQMIYAH